MKTKLVYGIGVMDIRGGTRIGYTGLVNPAYYRWKMMLRRCYSEEFLERNPTYRGCTVSDEWLVYSNFKEWHDAQGCVDGKELDKDIIDPGNKVYSAETCVFVEKSLNALLNQRKADRSSTGIIGVSRHPYAKHKFVSFCKVHGKNIYLGIFDNVDDASKVYRAYKINYIRSFIENETDERIRGGLEKHVKLLLEGTYGE